MFFYLNKIFLYKYFLQKMKYIKIALLTIIILFQIDKIKANEFSGDKEKESLYIVKDIEVYIQSTTADKAKQEAIKIGQRKALIEIFKKATIDEKYVKYVNESALSEMIELIKIKDEIITKNSYSSKLTIEFNKKFLNFHLKKLNISVGKVTNDVFLYIPVFKKDNKFYLMEQEDPWYKTAYNHFFKNNYENIFIIDSYNLANKALINDKLLLNPNYDLFNTLLNKYESNVVVIAIGEYDKNMNAVHITYKELDASELKEKQFSYINRDNLPEKDLIEESSVKILDYLNDESQKRIATNKNDKKNLEKYLTESFINIYILIPDLKEYVYIKTLLLNLDFIKKHDILELTTDFAKIRIFYIGNENELLASFLRKNFELRTQDGKYFLNYKGI